MKLRVGTRPSELALKQVEEIARSVPAVEFEIVPIETTGDLDKTTPLSSVEGGDFFTRQIEEALLTGKIDAAIHSAKDLPDLPAQGLEIAAITRSVDLFDALVSKGSLNIDELKIGAKVGASSLRRKTQLNAHRKDLRVVDIRGTIGERLQLLGEKDLDAVVVAAAALMRLGLEHRIAQRIPRDILEAHPLQGALAIQVRHGDEKTAALFRSLDARKG
jgi:hydroxymethylbilane synthase